MVKKKIKNSAKIEEVCRFYLDVGRFPFLVRISKVHYALYTTEDLALAKISNETALFADLPVKRMD